MKRFHRLRVLSALTVAATSMAALMAPPQFAAGAKPAEQSISRNSQVRSLPGPAGQRVDAE